MNNFSDNTSQNAMLNIVNDTLYSTLDDIGLPANCDTREMSWDEAAWACAEISEPLVDDNAFIYKHAQRLFTDASNLWDAIHDTTDIFN